MKNLEYLTHALGTAGWQAAALAVGISLYLRLCGRWMPPAWQHLLWLIPLVRLGLPELPSFSWSLLAWEEAPKTVIALAVPMLPTHSPSTLPVETAPPASSPWLPALWLIGMLATTALWSVRWFRTRHWIRQLSMVQQPTVHHLLREGCQAFGLRSIPELRQFEENQSPALAGLWKPVLLLPRPLVESGSDTVLRHVLWHELAHLKRRDLWTLTLSQFACVVHWYNPAAWWISRQLAQTCEPACDALAVRYLGRESQSQAPTAYARTLLDLMKTSRPASHAWVLSIGESGSFLGSRIKTLLNRPPGRVALGTGLFILSLFTVLGLTSRPSIPASPAPLLIEIESRLVEVPVPENAADRKRIDEILASADLEKISQIQGADFFSAPRVAVKNQQQAKITVAREFRYPTEYEWSAGENVHLPVHFESRDIGITLDLKPKVQGSHILLSGTLTQTEFEGFVQQKNTSLQSPIFSMRTCELNTDLLDGRPVVLNPIMERVETQTISDRIGGKVTEKKVHQTKKLAVILSARLFNDSPFRPDDASLAAAERLKSNIPLALATSQAEQFKSPFQPERDPIVLAGIASGTLVKCPYTGKIFRVP